MKITVLITSYNPGKYLKQAVQSVFDQTYKDWELIIIDDASTDNSLRTIKKFLADPKVKLIKNEENLGQAKSLNVGLKQVTTPFVVQLDSDDWFLPYTLATLVKEAKDQPEEVAVVSGNIKIVYQNTAGKEIKKLVRKGRVFKDRYDFLAANKSVWPRCYRTAALRQVKGWPTNGPYEGRYIEDLRILFRLIEKYRFHWINKTLYMHRKHAHNQTKELTPMVKTLEWLVKSTLRRWGNKYTAVFITTPEGYKQVAKLIPLPPEKKKTRG